MTTFVLLSKVSPAAIDETSDLSKMDVRFEKELAAELPEVKRIASYALLGPFDFMHIIEAPSPVLAARTALLANRFGAAATQTLTAIPFDEFRLAGKEPNKIHIAQH